MVDLRDEVPAAWDMLKVTLEEWNQDNTTRLAAALAYYTLFSLTPLLIIAVAIAGQVLDREAIQGQIVNEIGTYINDRNTAALVQTMIKNASAPKANFLATIIGVLILVYGATNVFSELKSSLNLIWDAPSKPANALRALLVDRFLALVMVMVSGFLLVASLLVNTFLNVGTQWIDTYWPGLGVLSQITSFLFFFGVTLIVFALIYKFIPDIHIAWRDVWIGAMATALLFSVGRFLISLYLSYGTFQSTYGVASSLAVLLLWTYYSAQIFFLGAQFTQVYGRTKGSRRREQALLQNTESPAQARVTGTMQTAVVAPELPPGQKNSGPRHVTQPVFDLVTAIEVIGAISLFSLVRPLFRSRRADR
jgi:membrane protein